MAHGLFASSKSALIFAGGVIACSALLAMTMGSQFTPKPRDETPQSEEATPSKASRTKRSRTAARTTQTSGPSEAEFFGDFEGFSSDQDLIDDTAGFDPTPTDNASVILEPADPSSDDPEPSARRRLNPAPSRGEEGRPRVKAKPRRDQKRITNWVSTGSKR